MTSRIRILLCALLVPTLAASAPQPASFSTPPPMPVQYLTQPDSQEPPWRYAAPGGPNALARLAWWNELAQRVQGYDHAPPTSPTENWQPEQMGRTRVSRVFAIVHIAMHDALAAICARYRPYVGTLPAYPDSSRDAAIAQAAHDTLVALYPRQAARIDAWLRDDLARLPDGRAKLNGIDVGRRAAAAILALRADDGSYQGEPVVGQDYPLGKEPGEWRPDPVSQIPYAVGAYWGKVRPFVLASGSQFRAPPPPALTSSAYTQAFNEVKALGGDGVSTPTRRTPDQTVTGIFWGYDSVAWLGTPVRMYNQIAMQLLLRKTSDAMELARALALVNVGIADATIAGWAAKYHYDFWRPVHGVREASPGTGPTGKGDGNPDTHGDPNWTPLGAPASNLTGPDFTPPFPSYPSGHACEGGALFHVLRKLYGDSQPFTFVSDEYDGVTRDNDGRVRPKIPRSYRNLTHAEEEAGQSRIYLGVHWQFDKQAGRAVSHQVVDYIFQRGLRPPAP
ncbi:vanadium-dependent haloperoxidase [Massilia sp. 9I]|uniref:vanadium-dependent haloperoxidase n=1 Tax=Massilia sp. 9I TaxID=2653152 RepID=UPI0012F10E4E|nr:vanadium-dependent haloperoxidase [Massilia sp. 9I]VXC65997.1 Chloroperoxidase [Massilia sp. 9I]